MVRPGRNDGYVEPLRHAPPVVLDDEVRPVRLVVEGHHDQGRVGVLLDIEQHLAYAAGENPFRRRAEGDHRAAEDEVRRDAGALLERVDVLLCRGGNPLERRRRGECLEDLPEPVRRLLRLLLDALHHLTLGEVAPLELPGTAGRGVDREQ